MSHKKLLIVNDAGLTDLNINTDCKQQCSALCESLGIELDFRLAANQNEILGWVAQDSINFDALIINPAGNSQPSADTYRVGYSSAIQSIAHLKIPIIEVQTSYVFHGQPYTYKPLQVPNCHLGFINGMGVQGYLLAINAIAQSLNS